MAINWGSLAKNYSPPSSEGEAATSAPSVRPFNKRGGINWASLAKNYERSQQEQTIDEEKKRKEEELKKKREESIKKSQEQGGDLVSSVGNFAKGVGEAIAAPFVRIGEGTAEVVNELTGGAERERQLQAQSRQENIQLIKSLGEKMRAAKTEEEKDRYREAIRRVSAIDDQQFKEFQERQQQTIERTDPIKGAAAVGEIGLNVLTGGTVGAVVKGTNAASKATNVAQKLISPTGVKQGIASGLAQGAVYGALGTAEDKGSQATAEDYVKGVAGGTLLGGATGGIIPAVVKGAKFPTITSTKYGEKVAQSKVGQKITNLKDNFVSKVVDDTNMIKKQFRGAVNPVTGQRITDEIEGLVTNVRQFAALSQSRLENNQAFQSLKPLLAGKRKNYDELGKFINEKQQAINLQKVGRGEDVVIPKGTPEQEEAYRLLNQATKDDVQYLFDNGKITQEQYEKWMSDPDYTRVQKEVLNDQGQQYGKSGLVSGSSVTQQKLKGSSKESVDPFAAYEDWSRQVTLEVEKNTLARYLRDQLVRTGKSNKIQTTNSAIDKIRQLYGEEGIKQRTLPVFEKGIKELYTIDPAAARQLSGVADLELKAIADWALLPSRILRGGATSLNPAFAVPNFIRDQVSSAVMSKDALATHNPLVFLTGLKEAILKPTAKATVGRIPGAKEAIGKLWEPSETYKLWASRNANITRADLSRNLKQATRQSLEDLGVKNESFLRKYENIISASEKATRYQNFLGTYKKALRKGESPEVAIDLANRAARENSVNFTKRGEVATFMKIFNPYFNASVQGSARLARSFKERPVGTSLKVGTMLLTPVAASTYYNLSDPDRAAVYANLPDYERKGNLIMVLGSGRGYIKVPLPPGMREFANPLRDFIESEYLGDRQSLLETAKDIFVDAFSPIGTTGGEVVSNLIPQAVKPAAEIMMNRNLFTGQEIIPDNLQDKAPEDQVFNSTPQIYRDIAQMFGVSPLQVQKVVQGYSASGGEGALTGVDLARGAETGGRSLPEQLAGRFFQPEVKGSGRVSNKFYETYNPLKAEKEKISGQITDAVKGGDIERASSLALQVNQRIEDEKNRLNTTYGKFEVDLSALFDKLDSLKFPMQGGYLSNRSIKSRLKQD